MASSLSGLPSPRQKLLLDVLAGIFGFRNPLAASLLCSFQAKRRLPEVVWSPIKPHSQTARTGKGRHGESRGGAAELIRSSDGPGRPLLLRKPEPFPAAVIARLLHRLLLALLLHLLLEQLLLAELLLGCLGDLRDKCSLSVHAPADEASEHEEHEAKDGRAGV